MTPEEQIEKNQWLRTPFTLQHYLWSVQPGKAQGIANYIRAWADWLYTDHGDAYPEKPATILFLTGPFKTGKTEIVARGLARYFVLNLRMPSVQYVYWPAYVKDQLNGKHLEINWDAKLLILDDFDGHRVIPQSMSTWLLEDMLAIIKPRVEYYKRPTIIITNRSLKGEDNLEKFFATPTVGQPNTDTKHVAEQVMSAITRNTFGQIIFNPLSSQLSELAKRGGKELRDRAVAENDMESLGFLYPREKYGIEVKF
jgi:hypothetical protein